MTSLENDEMTSPPRVPDGAINPITDYYEALAETYDQDRFGKSYGIYLNQMERTVLTGWLADIAPADVIDIGCGTGRLLDFAMTGLDPSASMLRVAARKYPDRTLIHAGLPAVNLSGGRQYRAATCFHVFMHLEPSVIAQSLAALARIVSAGGVLIFDIASCHRRAFKRRLPSTTGWHGNTSASFSDVVKWAEPDWRVVRRRGVLSLPIHRLPVFVRPCMSGLDALIGRTPLARYASYHVYQLERCA